MCMWHWAQWPQSPRSITCLCMVLTHQISNTSVNKRRLYNKKQKKTILALTARQIRLSNYVTFDTWLTFWAEATMQTVKIDKCLPCNRYSNNVTVWLNPISDPRTIEKVGNTFFDKWKAYNDNNFETEPLIFKRDTALLIVPICTQRRKNQL